MPAKSGKFLSGSANAGPRLKVWHPRNFGWDLKKVSRNARSSGALPNNGDPMASAANIPPVRQAARLKALQRRCSLARPLGGATTAAGRFLREIPQFPLPEFAINDFQG